MDQLDGPGGDHAALRAALVAHLRLERALYEPFVEDDEAFDTYCDRMARDGTWAGQIEVQALVRVRGVGVCIHQAGHPPWLVEPEAPKAHARLYLHIAYEDGEHYNSVRCSDGSDAGGPGGPKPLPAGLAMPADEGEGTTEADADEREKSSSPVQPKDTVAPAAKLSARERVEAQRVAKAAKAAARQRLAAGPRAAPGPGGDDALAAPLAALRL